MSDDVKVLLRRAVEWYEPTPSTPEIAVRRTKQRARRRKVTAGVTALVVFAGSAAILYGAFGGSQQLVDPRPGQEGPAGSRTSMLLPGVSIDYPGNWALVDLWFGCDGASARESCERATELAGEPIFQLSNRDLGLSGDLCSRSTPAMSDDVAALYVAYDAAATRVPGSSIPTWPVSLSGPDSTCGARDPGDSLAARWLGPDGTPYLAIAYVGPTAPAADREALFAAFGSMSFETARIERSGLTRPAYVVGSGVDRGRPWNLEVAPGPRGPEIILDLHQANVGGSVMDLEPQHTGLAWAGAQDGTMVWGGAAPEVVRIEAAGQNGDSAVGQVVAIPASLGAGYSAFVVSMPDPAGSTITAYDANGNEVTSVEFGVAPATGESCHGTAPPQTPPSAPPATRENVQSWLRNALVAAKTLYTDCASYEGLTPELLAEVEPTISYDTSATATQGTISIRDVSERQILFVTEDLDGTPWCIADIAGKRTSFGRVDAQTLERCTGGW